jgi:hypothetical protein
MTEHTSRSPATRKKISKSRLETAHRIADAWEELGLPETKKCNHPKHEGPNPQPISNFHLKVRRWSDGRVVRYPHGFCKDCVNRDGRERRAKLKRENPEEYKKRNARWRTSYKNRDRDAYREYQRIWTAAKRREKGIPERQFKRRSVTDGTPDVKLPLTEEFRAWLRSKRPLSRIELGVGFTPGALGRYIDKEAPNAYDSISLSLADRIIEYVNNGTRLEDFWPDV